NPRCSVAVVIQTLPFATTGDDQPSPGIAVFHATFFVSLHSSGRPFSVEWPCPSGPRNCGHDSCADAVAAMSRTPARMNDRIADTAYNAPVAYRWVMLLLAAAAMVGTLPGRTQGLGLVTEPLIADLGIGRVDYAQLNLWATLIGSLFAIGIGRFIDRLGDRIVLTTVTLALGAVVVAMSAVHSFWLLAITVTLTRGFGQSALSVISLTM